MRVELKITEMQEEEGLIDALVSILDVLPRGRPIIETGTFRGLGSTQILIKAVKRFAEEHPRSTHPVIHTIEINQRNFDIAKNNLKEYSWVNVIHGCSVFADEARQFIETDKAILEHEKYPDILIDTLDDPVKFYLKEIAGVNYGYSKAKDGILLKLIPNVYDKRPLFVLDSAGGIGWFEFQSVVNWMANRTYYVLLDDIGHLKHFRSAAYIRRCGWPILFENERCMLATHRGTHGNPNSWR